MFVFFLCGEDDIHGNRGAEGEEEEEEEEKERNNKRVFLKFTSA